MGEDGPVQEVVSNWEPELEEFDFSQRGDVERAEAEALLDAGSEGQRAYDLAAGPLVRWRLYRLDGTRHLFWVGMHHIVTDGWSLAVMFRELAEFYEAAMTQRPSTSESIESSVCGLCGLAAELAFWRGLAEAAELLARTTCWSFQTRSSGGPTSFARACFSWSGRALFPQRGGGYGA